MGFLTNQQPEQMMNGVVNRKTNINENINFNNINKGEI